MTREKTAGAGRWEPAAGRAAGHVQAQGTERTEIPRHISKMWKDLVRDSRRQMALHTDEYGITVLTI